VSHPISNKRTFRKNCHFKFRNFVSRRDVKIVRVKSEDSLYMVTQGLPLVLSIGCRMVFNHISSICLIIVQSQIMWQLLQVLRVRNHVHKPLPSVHQREGLCRSTHPSLRNPDGFGTVFMCEMVFASQPISWCSASPLPQLPNPYKVSTDRILEKSFAKFSKIRHAKNIWSKNYTGV
jgi:hypothetical protein